MPAQVGIQCRKASASAFHLALAPGFRPPRPGGAAGRCKRRRTGGALRPTLTANGMDDRFFESSIPGRTAGHGDGEAGRVTHDDAARPVGEANAWDAMRRHGAGDDRRVVVAEAAHVEDAGPKAPIAVEQAELFSRRQLLQQNATLVR